MSKLFLTQYKKYKGLTAAELMGVIMVIVILTAASIFVIHEFVESGKRSTTNIDASNLAAACGLYESQSKAGLPPANLGALVTGLTAAQSKDGVAKTKYVSNPEWTSDSATIVDQWNEPFLYDIVARTVTSNNNGKKPIVKEFP